MTQETLERLWAARRDGVRRMTENVSCLKECDQCRSISPKRYGLCPVCHGYRFKEDPATVGATLTEMARHPWPQTVGVVPRIHFAGRDWNKTAPAHGVSRGRAPDE